MYRTEPAHRWPHPRSLHNADEVDLQYLSVRYGGIESQKAAQTSCVGRESSVHDMEGGGTQQAQTHGQGCLIQAGMRLVAEWGEALTKQRVQKSGLSEALTKDRNKQGADRLDDATNRGHDALGATSPMISIVIRRGPNGPRGYCRCG